MAIYILGTCLAAFHPQGADAQFWRRPAGETAPQKPDTAWIEKGDGIKIREIRYKKGSKSVLDRDIWYPDTITIWLRDSIRVLDSISGLKTETLKEREVVIKKQTDTIKERDKTIDTLRSELALHKGQASQLASEIGKMDSTLTRQRDTIEFFKYITNPENHDSSKPYGLLPPGGNLLLYKWLMHNLPETLYVRVADTTIAIVETRCKKPKVRQPKPGNTKHGNKIDFRNAEKHVGFYTGVGVANMDYTYPQMFWMANDKNSKLPQYSPILGGTFSIDIDRQLSLSSELGVMVEGCRDSVALRVRYVNDHGENYTLNPRSTCSNRLYSLKTDLCLEYEPFDWAASPYIKLGLGYGYVLGFEYVPKKPAGEDVPEGYKYQTHYIEPDRQYRQVFQYGVSDFNRHGLDIVGGVGIRFNSKLWLEAGYRHGTGYLLQDPELLVGGRAWRLGFGYRWLLE